MLETLILTAIASGLLYFAWYIIVKKPVQDEMQKEKLREDNAAAARIARFEAELSDHDYFFNSENNIN